MEHHELAIGTVHGVECYQLPEYRGYAILEEHESGRCTAVPLSCVKVETKPFGALRWPVVEYTVTPDDALVLYPSRDALKAAIDATYQEPGA